jgi:Na+/H+-dicarboxylate symporter
MMQGTSNESKFMEQKGEDNNHLDRQGGGEEEEDGKQQTSKLGCGIMGRYPIISLLLFVFSGIGSGIGLSMWNPDENDSTSKEVALQWIGLVGDLFLRCLKAIVLPIVFVNVIIAVVDMMMVGAAGGVGAKTVGLYLATTLLAGTFGAIFSATFSRWFAVGENFTAEDSTGNAFITLGCSDSNSFLAQSADGSVSCTANWTDDNEILWDFNDVDDTFSRLDGSGGAVADISLSDTIYEGVFEKLFTDNVFVAFYEGNFAAVVVFAIALGIAASQVMTRSKTMIKPKDTTFMSFLIEIDQILSVMIGWVINITPFAVFSMIAAAIGGESNLGSLFKNVGLLVSCTLLGYICHYLLTYCGGYFLFTRKNPFVYLKHIFPAQLMGFACASSAATIPVNLKSVLSAGCHPTIARFVIPLGATINMDGVAIYFPVACIWLAIYNGVTPNISNYILLVIISTFGSMGAAPVPNAGLALIITTYNTVFNAHGIPDGFSFIFAIDWLMDRGATVVNVTGDSIVCGIISHLMGDGFGTDDTELEERNSSLSSSFQKNTSVVIARRGSNQLGMMNVDLDNESTDGSSSSGCSSSY